MRRFAARGYDGEVLDGNEHVGPTVDSAMQAGLLLDLERALAALPPDQRTVLLLVGLEDFGYREAADILGIPIGTVMSRLARGRARLRLLMEGPSAPRADDGTAPLQIVR
jgi:RNA polymerase sigma-70 factor, ECF subfamily